MGESRLWVVYKLLNLLEKAIRSYNPRYDTLRKVEESLKERSQVELISGR